MDVDLYADPSCRWSWAAYRWLDAVAPRRQLRPRLRPFSLTLRDGTDHLPADLGRARRDCHRALRVCTVLDDDRRWEFFRAVCEPIYAALTRRQRPAVDIARALAVTGLDAGLLAVADDPSADEPIRASMAAIGTLLPAAGEAQKIPVLVLHDGAGRHALRGPLLDPAPVGRPAAQLWDAVERLARHAG